MSCLSGARHNQRPTTLDRIRPIIAEALTIDPETITPDSTLESLGADSLDVVSIVSDCEAELNTARMPDDVLAKMRTVGDLAAALEGMTP